MKLQIFIMYIQVYPDLCVSFVPIKHQHINKILSGHNMSTSFNMSVHTQQNLGNC
jgi:hypothetical protein